MVGRAVIARGVAGHAEIARTLEMPVATGEIHATRWDFRAPIEQRRPISCNPMLACWVASPNG